MAVLYPCFERLFDFNTLDGFGTRKHFKLLAFYLRGKAELLSWDLNVLNGISMVRNFGRRDVCFFPLFTSSSYFPVFIYSSYFPCKHLLLTHPAKVNIEPNYVLYQFAVWKKVVWNLCGCPILWILRSLSMPRNVMALQLNLKG